MFEGLGNIASLLTQLPKIKSEMAQLKQKLEQIVVEGTAGGGMVTARVSGTLELLECRLSDEAMKMGDKEMLEDLIRAGVNQAMEKARMQAGEEARKVATGLGLPAGFNLPSFLGGSA
jgi:DNA-binding YbaB/EbfC family protein